MRPTKCNSTIKIHQAIAQKRHLQNAYRLLLELYEPIISYKKQATASHFSTKWILQNHLYWAQGLPFCSGNFFGDIIVVEGR